MLLTQSPLTSSRRQNNVVSVPSSEFECFKPSIMSTTVECKKVKTEVLNKTRDDLFKITSKFKSTCSSKNDDCSVSNYSTLVAETFNILLNPIFVQHVKSIIALVQLDDNKLKGHEIVQCEKMLTVIHFYQATPTCLFKTKKHAYFCALCTHFNYPRFMHQATTQNKHY